MQTVTPETDDCRWAALLPPEQAKPGNTDLELLLNEETFLCPQKRVPKR
jgi:hypothetical protein